MDKEKQQSAFNEMMEDAEKQEEIEKKLDPNKPNPKGVGILNREWDKFDEIAKEWGGPPAWTGHRVAKVALRVFLTDYEVGRIEPFLLKSGLTTSVEGVKDAKGDTITGKMSEDTGVVKKRRKKQ